MQRLVMSAFLALVLLSFGSRAPSQGGVTTAPSYFSDTWGTFAIAAPLGRTRLFFQHWHRGDQLGYRRIITNIGWRQHNNTLSLPALKHRMEIVLGNTTAGFALSKTFANNLGTSKLFVKMKDISFPAASGAPKDPNTPLLWVKGDAPFLYTGPNFIYQIDVQTTTNWSSNGYNVDGYTATATMHRQGGKSCGGTLSAGYSGTTYSLTLSGAKPSTIASIALGGRLFPSDIGGLLGAGCKWDVEPLAFFAVPTNASGGVSISAPWPITTDTLVIHAQALHQGTGSGLVSTNRAASALGSQGLNMYVYNYTRPGTVAQYGPYATNRGPIVLLK